MALKERKFYPKFIAYAKGGRLEILKKDEFARYMAALDGKELEVTAKPRAKDRSRQEEKYYHAVVVRMVADAMGTTDQEAHEFLKKLFLTEEETTSKGIRFERTLSTTELSDSAYREFWGKCVQWAALPTLPGGLNQSSGLELYIPFPNEADYDNY